MYCADGSFPDALDLLQLVFPNNGTNFSKDYYNDNACWALTPFHFEVTDALLPPSSGLYTRDGLVDSVTCLIVACCLLSVGFIVAHFLWSKFDCRFASISPLHKKWYVVANMSKCILLGIICASSKYWIAAYRAFVLDEFLNIEGKRMAVIYVATDAVALFLVPKLPTSTALHHVTSILLLTVYWGVDMHVKGWTGLLGVVKMMMLYGTFSTISFAVNGYLALRVVYPRSSVTSLLCRVALWIYVTCCFGNWFLHLLWFGHSFYNGYMSLIVLLYAGCIGFIVHDDIVLIKWLFAKSSPVNTAKFE